MYHDNRPGSFCIILLTNKPTTKQRREHNPLDVGIINQASPGFSLLDMLFIWTPLFCSAPHVATPKTLAGLIVCEGSQGERPRRGPIMRPFWHSWAWLMRQSWRQHFEKSPSATGNIIICLDSSSLIVFPSASQQDSFTLQDAAEGRRYQLKQ